MARAARVESEAAPITLSPRRTRRKIGPDSIEAARIHARTRLHGGSAHEQDRAFPFLIGFRLSDGEAARAVRFEL